MISDIERIGDHAEGIASYIIELDKKFEKDLFEQLRFTKMYDIALQMLEMLEDAFDREDLGLARKIFKLDKSLNEIKLAAPDVITDYLRNDSEATKQALFLFSTIRKLERVGDLCKNIAEQLIFYAEAKVVKHRSEK